VRTRVVSANEVRIPEPVAGEAMSFEEDVGRSRKTGNDEQDIDYESLRLALGK
jgi:hypothetical protein